MRIFKSSNLWILAGVCLVAGIVWQLSRGDGGAGPDGKRYGKVKRGDLVQRVTVSGLIQPERKTVFVAPFDGYIKKLYVKIGEKVRQGDPVLSVASSLASPEPVFPIRAPFAGTVVDIEKQEGEYVAANASSDQKKMIVRIDDVSKFYVLAKSAELDAARIKTGMEVEIRVNAFKSAPLKGIVREIDLAAEEADGWRNQQATFGVRVEILDPPAAVRSGQSAIVDIVTDKFPNVLYLEHEFVAREGGKSFVITRRGRRRDVKVGRQSDLAVEILDGLREGDEVEQVDFLKLLEGGA